MKVVILCGGQGTRLREETEIKPKPMVEIGGMPILWHIMKTYANYGFKDFILCLGYKGDVIKNYFYNYELLANDFTVELGKKNVKIYSRHSERGWRVTLVDTGLKTMTGGRIKRIEEFIGSDNTFMLTYGDGVTNLDIKKLLSFHKNHGCIGTVTGVFPPSRYGELLIQNDKVVSFNEKPVKQINVISGGYFIFNREIFKYIKNDDSILEKDVLEKLVKKHELKVFSHSGFWQCMDTYRDREYLNELWKSGQAFWKVWKNK